MSKRRIRRALAAAIQVTFVMTLIAGVAALFVALVLEGGWMALLVIGGPILLTAGLIWSVFELHRPIEGE